LGLREAFFEGFCHSKDALVDVIDDVALLIERTLDCGRTGLAVFELVAEICIGLLEISPKTAAGSLGYDEAEGIR
jgi:hypothetical protein